MSTTPTPTGGRAGGGGGPAHWSIEEFRRRGHEAVDRVADYWAALRQADPPWPVRSARGPGATAALLPEAAPERGEPWEAIIADVERVVMPGLMHWQSPGFFGYFPANASGPGVIGEVLSAGLGVQGMLWSTSPACTEIETRMLDWMGQAIDLPARFLSSGAGGVAGGGVIQGTASEGTLVALLAARARERARRGGGDERAGGGLVAYTSTEAHSSVIKAAMIAGVARDATAREGLVGGPGAGVRLIAVDGSQAMRVGALERAMAEDRRAGRRPCFVAATVGTTGTMGVDDVGAIGEVCARHGAWLHVDAAYAGAACVCPEHRGLLAGVERADSVGFNPHKWLLTNFDCSLFWTADRASVTGALSITPEYLRNAASEAGAVWDYRDWQVPLGRRFRALKLWLVMRSYGLEGLRAHIREHVRLAGVLAELARADARFEVVGRPALGLVCVRLRAGNEATRALLERVNRRGRAFFSHTVIGAGEDGGEGTYVIRVAIGGTWTTEADVRSAWAELAGQAGAGGSISAG